MHQFSCSFFLKQSSPQGSRHVVPGDCFITKSISMNLMPEMVSFLVSQHQMPKFRMKHGKFHKETIHIPTLNTSLSVLIKDFHL